MGSKLLGLSFAWMAFAVFLMFGYPANPMLYVALICGNVCAAGHEVVKAIDARALSQKGQSDGE